MVSGDGSGNKCEEGQLWHTLMVRGGLEAFGGCFCHSVCLCDAVMDEEQSWLKWYGMLFWRAASVMRLIDDRGRFGNTVMVRGGLGAFGRGFPIESLHGAGQLVRAGQLFEMDWKGSGGHLMQCLGKVLEMF